MIELPPKVQRQFDYAQAGWKSGGPPGAILGWAAGVAQTIWEELTSDLPTAQEAAERACQEAIDSGNPAVMFAVMAQAEVQLERSPLKIPEFVRASEFTRDTMGFHIARALASASPTWRAEFLQEARARAMTVPPPFRPELAIRFLDLEASRPPASLASLRTRVAPQSGPLRSGPLTSSSPSSLSSSSSSSALPLALGAAALLLVLARFRR